jgi:hypothetical protein
MGGTFCIAMAIACASVASALAGSSTKNNECRTTSVKWLLLATASAAIGVALVVVSLTRLHPNASTNQGAIEEETQRAAK